MDDRELVQSEAGADPRGQQLYELPRTLHHPEHSGLVQVPSRILVGVDSKASTTLKTPRFHSFTAEQHPQPRSLYSYTATLN